MTVAQKTLSDLGWTSFLDRVAARCAAEEAAALARQLPFVDVPSARSRMQLIMEFKNCIDNDDPPPLLDVIPCGEALALIDAGGSVTVDMFLAIAQNIRRFVSLFRYLENRTDTCPENAALVIRGEAAGLPVSLSRLAAEIDATFEPDGTIRDTASPELGRLRRRIQSLRQNLLAHLDAIVRNNDDILQELTITQRGDRYVVAVRANAHHPLPGIVHGSSGTGATIFVEPRETVEEGNDLTLAKEAVRHEEQRILNALRGAIREQSADLRRAIAATIEADVRIASGKVCWDIDGHIPLCGAPGALSLRAARHPLLILDGIQVVANDIDVTPGRTMLISGPNAGGKTVVLKTVGLLSLMLKAGFPISAGPDSSAGELDDVFSDIGDDQSIADSLSTFSAHMRNIAGILDAAGEGSIVLLDELCAGTDPTEGTCLARSILDRLNAMKVSTLATTHFDALKSHATDHAQFMNAGMGFDLLAQKPTYRLKPGTPGTSSALSTAQRYGIPESIVEQARLLLPESVRRLNTAAQAVEAEQARLAAERREMETEKLAARDLARQYAQKLDALKKKESAFVDKETEALWDAIRKAREAVRDAEKSIKRRSADPAAIKTARTDINRIAAELEKGGTLSSSAKSSLPGRTATPADIVPGAPVHIISMGKAGIVEVPLKGNTVTAKVNNVRMRVSIDDVRILDSRPADRPSTAHRPLTGPLLAGDAIRTSANTLDLRGATVEEGAARVDAFLDRALRQQTDVVYILTGFGTGALTTGIRRHLERSPYVETHRPGNEGEGGDAVTAVFLR